MNVTPLKVAASPVMACRSCSGRGLRSFLDLGATPIANALVAQGDLSKAEPRFPLEVGFCPDCTLVQLMYELPATAIFGPDYPYFSSFSEALCRHARQHALELIASRGLTGDALIVEVASNDGYLLRNFVEAGIPVIGIEPTPGPAAAARDVGVPTRESFFTAELAASMRREGIRADVIIANNVMAHVPDLNGFIQGFRTLLADDGLITIENPYVRDLVEHGQFDTVYHEHFSYFSCTAVDRLMKRHDLYLNDVEFFPDLHGGTLRWHVEGHDAPTSRLRSYLADEQARGMHEFAYYASFGERAQATRTALARLLRSLRSEGKRIAAYGAAAKGATLLNSSDIDASLVEYVVDRNPHKQGRWLPGARLPILDPTALLERAPDYVLILAWNFKDEIIAEQAEYQRRGGRFIVPIPTPQIL